MSQDSSSAYTPTHLTERFVGALEYAARLHLDQERKCSRVPYLGHLLGVCSLVIEEGGSEDEAIAALLHDAVEDQGGRPRLEEIRALYGADVAQIVETCTDYIADGDSDSASKPWCERKTAYLKHLEDSARSRSELLVSLADKLFNARAIRRDREEVGEVVWDRFGARRDGQLWYYGRLAEVFERRAPNLRMTKELAAVVADLNRLGTRAGAAADD